MPPGASPAAFFYARRRTAVQLVRRNACSLSDTAYLLMWGGSPKGLAQICYNWTMHKGCEKDCFHK